MRKPLIHFILGICISLGLLQNVYAAPSGYNQVQSATGWKLYHNSSKNVYVQEVKLSQARLEFRCRSWNTCSNVSLFQHWISRPSNSYAVVNGTFHDFGDPANMALAITNRYYLISQGYDSSNTSNQRMLLLDESRSNADVVPGYNYSRMVNSDGAILGFHPTNVSKSKYVDIGRTFIGTSSSGDKVFIFSAYAESQWDMVRIARSFGVSSANLIMLDGSGSSQLRTSQKSMYGNAFRGPDYRNVPQVIYTVRK